MTDPSDADSPAAETPWSPRFSNESVAWTGLVLLLLFVSMAGWFRSVFDGADLFEGGAGAGKQVSSYVLFVVGLLLLHVGVWFAVVEARTPPVAGTVGAAAVDPGGILDKVVPAIAGRKVSTVAFSLGFTLVVLAAAGSGLVDVSIGDDVADTTSTTVGR